MKELTVEQAQELWQDMMAHPQHYILQRPDDEAKSPGFVVDMDKYIGESLLTLSKLDPDYPCRKYLRPGQPEIVMLDWQWDMRWFHKIPKAGKLMKKAKELLNINV